MNNITLNTTFAMDLTVSSENTAISVGSGDLEVFATPMMIALMEKASSLCLKPFLEDSETSVGTFISTTHTSATPVGIIVKAISTIIEINGKEITFHITAEDNFGQIGEATHKRFVVNSEKFLQKAKAKLAE